ncbi:hypothetical protein GNY06_08940 [Elizabethkingia argentiflava]|uniref:Uncharacterized protein n=1 Tax=Elizabethkingia argenteiflava TaxID=2681556 RepID=A0A845PYG1_9FLAO|nr:hypothetical protein [Elizabethkingia argenteiflava]NAW51497.1 hypothetical protein [Elizabethkingia argenteiflava]
MNNLSGAYEIILEDLRKISKETPLSYQRRGSKRKNLECIGFALTAEYIRMYSENYLFRYIPKTIKSKLKPSLYNPCKGRLEDNADDTRLKIAQRFNEFDAVFIINSLAVEASKHSGNTTSKICNDAPYYDLNRGFCAAEQMHFYVYKLHAVCSLGGVFPNVDKSRASADDIHYIKDS